ncbi:MAG: branched-chain amino acid ABC transporter permease [Thalassovita sp.]
MRLLLQNMSAVKLISLGIGIIVCLALPQYAGLSLQLDLSIIFVYAILALSMGFMWGQCGMLSFGQTVFFGLGGYTYAIWSLNTGDTTTAMLMTILLPMIVAALLGYFVIYGGIGDIYFAVITMVSTIALEKAVRATSDPKFMIGDVRLQGQNGIAALPDLQVPWNASETLFVTEVYYFIFIAMVVVTAGYALLLRHRIGRVLVGIRENEQRINLLGYDSRRYKLLIFVISGGVAGLSGGLYAIWGNFVAPEMMNLNSSAAVVINVLVGGKSSLLGPLVGTGIVQSLTSWLGSAGVGQVNLVLGLILIAAVQIFPQGVVPMIGAIFTRLTKLASGITLPSRVDRQATTGDKQ